MSAKEVTAVLVLVVLFSAGSGAWIGHRCFPAGAIQPSDDNATRQGIEQSPGEIERKRLQTALARATARIQELEEHLSGDDAGNAAEPQIAMQEDHEDEAGPGQVDWKNLYSLFNKNAELLATVTELEKENKSLNDHLSPEQIAALQEMQAEWYKAASRARVLSKYPVLDSAMLPDILKASLGGLLNLSDDQLAIILSETLQDPLSGEELASTTPLEAYAKRLDLVDRLASTIPDVLDDPQIEAWQSVQETMMPLFQGKPKYTRLGLEGERTNVLNWITRAWREHYGLPKDMAGVLDGMAGEYLESVRDVFQRHGDPHGHLQNLDRPVRDNLEIDLLALQLETESGLLEHLTPEQTATLVGKTPWLIQFELSTAISLRNGGRVGF